MNDLNQKRLEVMEWAHKHDFIIDPFKGMDSHIESFFKVGRCPCDKTRTRLNCPCEESLVDVLETGRCLCSFFWTREAAIAAIKKSQGAKDRKSWILIDGKWSNKVTKTKRPKKSDECTPEG